MKTLKKAILTIACVFSLGTSAIAQDSPFSVGADLVSSYVWRGVRQSDGPAVQPGIEFNYEGLSVGAWGSYDVVDGGPAEADLYLSYGFDFGLSIGLCDYYYEGSDYFNYSNDTTGSHGFELNLGYEIGNLSIAANYFLTEETSIGNVGNDMYFELGYAFDNIDVFVGAGDGWLTDDAEFKICNVGIGTSKEIKINENFSLPMFGSVSINPSTEQYYIVVGISL